MVFLGTDFHRRDDPCTVTMTGYQKSLIKKFGPRQLDQFSELGSTNRHHKRNTRDLLAAVLGGLPGKESEKVVFLFSLASPIHKSRHGACILYPLVASVASTVFR